MADRALPDDVAALLARAVPGYEPRVRRRARRPRLALVAVALVAAVTLTVTQLGPRPAAELEAVLVAPGGGEATATARVTKTGIGRVVAFRTDDLPILPKGEFYELWFVGPGDTLARPNRISAGTFHPDEQGRSEVELTAAVDPALYPALSVTAEPAEGEPRRTGPEILRSLG